VIIVVMIVWTRSGSHPVRPFKMAIRWKCSTSEHEVSHNGGNVFKSSRRAEAARKQAEPAAEDFVHSAADRVGPLVHTAAERVGPLAQSAATRVGPLAEAAADRIGVTADKVSPLAHTAADRLGPLAQSAAERVGPMAHGAADRIAPLAHSAADRIAPFATGAVDRVTPYAHQAAGRVSPYAHQAAERIAPIATSAKQRGARVAQGAVEKIGPALDDALGRLSPAVDAARGKMSSEVLPKLSEALLAAGGVAPKGELEVPEKKKRKSRWFLWLALAAGVAGVAVILVRKFLGSKDTDWQAARPTTPYGSTKPTETAEAPSTAAAAASAPVVDEMDDSGEDPQGGQSAHLLNLEADGAMVPDQPAEGGAYDAPADNAPADNAPADMTTLVDEAFADAEAKITGEAPAGATSVEEEMPVEATPAETAAVSEAGTPKYEGEGVYIGNEPPEGFTIKGNQRSMKYHVPESAGYGRTVAEVWFNSEEAAQQAGFVRAQR
jgi:hypothetical protein